MANPTLGIGNRIAPPRFIAFVVLLVLGTIAGVAMFGWSRGGMAGFDIAASVFLLSCLPLLDDPANKMRETTRANDANRALLLGLTAVVTIAILIAIAAELGAKRAPSHATVALVVGTLTLAWLFTNTVYALHYAHMFYMPDDGDDAGEKDAGGLDVPGTDEPDYWDFVYFAFTLGMTFQTSDIEMKKGGFRRVATAHCLAAFVFNIGVLAFTINVLGGG